MRRQVEKEKWKDRQHVGQPERQRDSQINRQADRQADR